MSGRLPPRPGEWIDRSRPLCFRFEGRPYQGFEGDTISSALWASGVRVLGRSFKYHRPRGIFSLGHDSNTVMQDGGHPNVRADVTALAEGMDLHAVNTRGGVDRDRLAVLDRLGTLTPVGFYYKAFHTPRALFPWYERRIRAMAGLGTVPDDHRHRHTPKDYAFCDVLVAGAGAAGLSAAVAAAGAGARVLVAETDARPGGSARWQRPSEGDAADSLARLLTEATASERIELRLATEAAGLFADHWVALVDGRRLTKLRARAVVAATGSREQPAVFRNNDLPGVMLASAAQRLIHRYAVRPCARAVVLAANDDGYRAALDLVDAGVEVAAIADPRREGQPPDLAPAVAERGIPVLAGHAVYETTPVTGKRGLREAVLCELDGDGAPRAGTFREVACDGLIVSVGWAPADDLLRQAGARMDYDTSLEAFVPAALPAGLLAAGRVNGVYGLAERIEDGRRAGLAAATHCGLGTAPPPFVRVTAATPPSHPYPVLPHPRGKDFVDLDEDLQTKDIRHAAREGFDRPELLKRYATVGMGPSQGKHSNLLALRILSDLRGEPMTGQSMTTARPYSSPVPLGHLAGRTFNPRRHTPPHVRHEELGAVLMYAGNWLRPEYYPLPGRAREECIEDEALTVRRGVGLIDLGTLGKIEVSGPDAAAFLERIYTGGFTTLKVGMARYGVACDESGVMIDDGVVGRLADDRYYASTTTGASDGVHRKLLWWLAQWRMQVWITNVTGHYGAMNLAGPASREVLQPLVDTALEEEAFPYMAVRECTVAGVPCRVLRVGFVGELGYEIHPRADGSLHVWDALMAAGRDAGIRPFGVEAQRLLRLEKGHLILGQDTDGLTHPDEAAYGWAVRMKKPFFVGQRSLAILRGREQGRRLVGFVLAEGRRQPAPRECHLVVDGPRILGRVTSCRYSPTLGRVIGLAYVPPAVAEPGSTFAIKIDGGETVDATVAAVPFYDPDNLRQKPAPAAGGEAP